MWEIIGNYGSMWEMIGNWSERRDEDEKERIIIINEVEGNGKLTCKLLLLCKRMSIMMQGK
jgi:hypothetical protein